MVKHLNEDDNKRFKEIDSGAFTPEEVDEFKKAIKYDELYAEINNVLGTNVKFKVTEDPTIIVSEDLTDKCGILSKVIKATDAGNDKDCKFMVRLRVNSDLALMAFADVHLCVFRERFKILHGRFRRGQWDLQKGDMSTW